ncbi:MAG: hypothetical protein WCZ65_03405 [Lysobacteraceae bacterium]
MGRGSRHNAPHLARLRQQVAAEAARLITEHGISDLAQARRKAAERLRIDLDSSQLPRPEEIQAALREHQRLFSAGAHEDHLRALRQAALEAMTALAAFDPRLVGEALDGTADAHTPLRLHLFSDEPEAPIRLLDELGIRHTQGTRRMRLAAGAPKPVTVLRFDLEGIAHELLVLPLAQLRQAPAGDEPGQTLPRAGIEALRRLLDRQAD